MLDQPAQKPRRKPHRLRLQPDEAIVALREHRGLIGPASEALGTSRSNLTTFIRNHSRVAVVLWEEREKLGDVAEKKRARIEARGVAHLENAGDSEDWRLWWAIWWAATAAPEGVSRAFPTPFCSPALAGIVPLRRSKWE
jgi:hypothetical protein